jgi:hypothetical protein
MSALNRARLGRGDFESMVSDLAKETSNRLGLEWINEGTGDWAADVAGQSEFGPKLIYNGPESVFSTCQDIVRWPSYVFDVNGYYATLGVPWWATKKEIVAAYIDKVGVLQDEGDRVRLTYIFKVLQDPERRAKYDAVPLGAIFNDPFVQESIRLHDAWEASQKLLKGEVTFDELMDMQTALDEDDADVDDDVLNRSRQDGLTAQNQMIGGGQWRWSYYTLDSQCDDHAVLSRWQALLVRYISRKKKGVRIAVGFIGVGVTPSLYEVHEVGKHTVVFISDKSVPTRRLAKKAASAVVKHIKARG